MIQQVSIRYKIDTNKPKKRKNYQKVLSKCNRKTAVIKKKNFNRVFIYKKVIFSSSFSRLLKLDKLKFSEKFL